MTDNTAAVPTIPSGVSDRHAGDGTRRAYDKQGFLIRGAQPTRVEAFVDAAFALAVTLLVVSVGRVPDSMGELLNAMRGVPAFAASFIIIAQLNRQAFVHAGDLGLSARECVRTREVIHRWRGIAGVALISVALALMLPIDWYGGWLAVIPGLAYVLIWPVGGWVKRRANAALAVQGDGE